MRRIYFILMLCFALAARAAAEDPVVFDDINAQFDPAFLIYDPSLYDIGWYYTPTHTYTLKRIETKFVFPTFRIEDVDRDVTFNVYTERPAAGGTLLATETFNTHNARNFLWGEDLATPVTLTAGKRYFIGLLNIGGLGINVVPYQNNDYTSETLQPGTTNLGQWAIDVGGAAHGTFGNLVSPTHQDPRPLFAQPILRFLGNIATPAIVCSPNPLAPFVKGPNLPYTSTVDTSANPLNSSLVLNNNIARSPGAFWRFQPPSTGLYFFDASSDFDPTIVIATGDCCNQTPVFNKSDVFAKGSEHGVFTLNSSIAYTVIGRGFLENDFGSLTMNIEGPVVASSNNTCAAPLVIAPAALPYSKTVINWSNVSNVDIAEVTGNGGGGGPDAWWSFTPAQSGLYDIRAYGHGLDLAIGLYTGSCGSLTEVNYADDNDNGERLRTTLTAGVKYMILVEGFDATQKGKIAFTLTKLAAPAAAGTTCAFATAISASALPYTNVVDTTQNPDTMDSSAVEDNGGGGAPDAWWKFTPAVTGTYLIGVQQADALNASDAKLDLALTVYKGSCGALQEVKSVDDRPTPDEITSITLTAGVTYTIQTEGYSPHDYGKMMLYLDGPCVKRANSTCAGATILGGNSGTHAYFVNTLGNIDTKQNSASATRFHHAQFGPSPDAFFRFTPSAGGLYSIKLTSCFTQTSVPFSHFIPGGALGASVDIDVAFGVYQGDCNHLQELVARDSSYSAYDTRQGERATLSLTAGVPYTILCEGAGTADQGPMQLTISGPLQYSVNSTCAARLAVDDWPLYE